MIIILKHLACDYYVFNTTYDRAEEQNKFNHISVFGKQWLHNMIYSKLNNMHVLAWGVHY